MDISAILPVNMGNDGSRCLNDDFSAQTPAGDNIFSKPLGAKTFFRTNTNGLVCASFMFDPKHKYAEDHHMASVTSDWMGDMRDALTRHLLDPEDIAPKTKSLEETVWDQLTTTLPKETLAKNLFSDKKVFDEYTALLRKSVTKNFNEEKKLWEIMGTKKFSFSFEIAIDAYPEQLGGVQKDQYKKDKTGVLTFHLEGIPDGVMPVNKKEKDSTTNDKPKGKKRKHQETEGCDADKLLKDMAVYELYKDAHVEKDKKYPLTAIQFFESVNRWFSSVVSRRAARLEKDRNRNPLYH